jgi:hypothetical protein
MNKLKMTALAALAAATVGAGALAAAPLASAAMTTQADVKNPPPANCAPIYDRTGKVIGWSC